MLQKFLEKYIKNQRNRSFRNHQEREGGPPLGDQDGPWRGPTLGRARRPPGCLVGPLDTPLRLYLALGVETPNIDLFSVNSPLYRRRPVSRSGLPGEAAPAPCQEEEPPPGDHP